MTDPAQPIPPPGDDPQGSLGAVLIGGAILLIAGLFIFWPDSDGATAERGKAGARANAAQHGSNSAAGERSGGGGGGVDGLGRGIDPRDIDPARAQSDAERTAHARLTPGLLSPGLTMAPPPKPVPEPTSFASTADEIAYVEKKLTQARADLDARATFLERMQKIQQKSKSVDEDERNAARAKIVQQNYETARTRVEELEKRLKSLKGV